MNTAKNAIAALNCIIVFFVGGFLSVAGALSGNGAIAIFGPLAGVLLVVFAGSRIAFAMGYEQGRRRGLPADQSDRDPSPAKER